MRFSAPTIRLELRPLRLQLLAAVDLLPFGHLEARVDVRLLVLVEGQLRQAALVVDRHGRPVLDRAPDVVDADVVAEHGAGAGVRELDRRAGEADERGVGQRVAQVARVAVEEVVLAAVRLVGDHDDVAPLGEERMPVALVVRKELLDRGEHDPARFHPESGAQVGPAGGLHRRLAQQVGAAREGAEELVVEVVAVGQHDDGGILHRRLADDAPGVEGHGQTLARPLRVPDDADSPVARRSARLAARFVAPGRFARGVRPPLQLRRA